jgi:adenylosuccinate lyase
MNRWISLTARIVMALSLIPASARADDAEAIDYRRHVMRTLGEQIEALAMTVQKKAPAENFNWHVKTLALASTQALKAFEPKVEGGNSKPEVWTSWKDFAVRMNEMVTKLAALDQKAQQGGMAAAAAKVQASLSCQGCHDAYAKQLPAIATQGAPKDAVKYREYVMNTLDAQSSALGQILSTEIPDDNLVSHLDVIAATAATATKAFEPKVPGGEAKPTVWSNWPDFSKRMNEFAQRTADTAKIAHDQGKEAALNAVVEALTCKGCHDTYREKK